jgi:hypothetical protein
MLAIFTSAAIFTVAMKYGDEVKIAGALDPETLRILRALPGVAAEVAEPPDPRIDAVLYAAGGGHPLVVAARRRVHAGAARLLVEEADRAPDGVRVVVVASQTTAAARQLLEDHGIGVVDGDGNAHIALPGVVVHVEGRSAASKHDRTHARLSGRAGVVAQTLLLGRGEAWKVTDLAERAGVSVGLAHRVLKRLEDERIVRAEGAGPGRVRHVDKAGALLDLWAEEQLDRPLRTRAYLLAQTTRQTIDGLAAGLDAVGVPYALTGPAGASLVAPFASAIPVVDVWVPAAEAPSQLCQAAGAEVVDAGHNLMFLQASDDSPLLFRRRVDGRCVANPFRLYVDLVRTPQRGREQAAHLRAEAIGF